MTYDACRTTTRSGRSADIIQTSPALRDATPRGRPAGPAIKHSAADKELPKLDSFTAGSAPVEPGAGRRELRSCRNDRHVAPKRMV